MKIIVDTNVLYAGLYSAEGASHQVLRLVEARVLVPVLSTSLLFEYEDVLRRNSDELGLSVAAIDEVLNALCARGVEQRTSFLWRPRLRDAGDDHILELAMAAQGVPIVTHTIRDFGPAAKCGVRVITPGRLLEELR